MSFEDNIKKLGLILPNAADHVGSYVAAKKSGNLLFISGQISMNEKGREQFIKVKSASHIKLDRIILSEKPICFEFHYSFLIRYIKKFK